MFRKFKDKNGQCSSGAQMREGQMLFNSMLCGEMPLVSEKLLGSVLDEKPDELPRAASSLMEMALLYMDTMYEAIREHAGERAYQLTDPKAVALGRI
jgi:hypothetical protein